MKQQKYALMFLLVFLCSFAICFSVYADDTMIYGCYKKNKGQLRVVGQGSKCLPSEIPISWNQTGPAGASSISSSIPVRQIQPGDCVDGYGWCPDDSTWGPFLISDPIVSESSIIAINIVNPSLYGYGCEVVTKAAGEFQMTCVYSVRSDAILQYAVFNP